jgi:hypothetical protein
MEQAWKYGTLAPATVNSAPKGRDSFFATLDSNQVVLVPYSVFKCGDVAAIRRGSKVLVVAVSGDNGKVPKALLAMPNPL